jgi:large subunit ribosomal protein L17
MRHRKDSVKLGRSPAHRAALVASLVGNLIIQKRIRTTLEKAKLARRRAEKLVTLARKGTLAARRLAIAQLDGKTQLVAMLFADLLPKFEGRHGGYTRILKTSTRRGDGAQMALLEWVGVDIPVKTRKKKPEEGENKPKT